MPRMERSPWQYEIARGSAFNRDGVFSVSVREECVLGTHRTTSRLFVSSLDVRSMRKERSKRNRLPLSLLNHAWHSDILSTSDSSVTLQGFTPHFLYERERKLRDSKRYEKYAMLLEIWNKNSRRWIIGAKRLIYVTGIHRTTSLLEFQRAETLTCCDKSYESLCMYIHYTNSSCTMALGHFSTHLQKHLEKFVRIENI